MDSFTAFIGILALQLGVKIQSKTFLELFNQAPNDFKTVALLSSINYPRTNGWFNKEEPLLLVEMDSDTFTWEALKKEINGSVNITATRTKPELLAIVNTLEQVSEEINLLRSAGFMISNFPRNLLRVNLKGENQFGRHTTIEIHDYKNNLTNLPKSFFSKWSSVLMGIGLGIFSSLVAFKVFPIK